MRTLIVVMCLFGSVAFLVHAGLAPFYETGLFRFISPVFFLLFAALLLAFSRRRLWTWRWVLSLTLLYPIIYGLYPPTEQYYGPLTSAARLLVLIECLACVVLFIAMLLPSAKRWFYAVSPS